MTGHLVFIFLLGSFQEVHLKALPQAKLTVDSSAIIETDSVTLSCQSPAHVSVHQCFFHVNEGSLTPFPCINTFKGTELVLMAKQRSSFEFEVRCFYVVKSGDLTASPDSDASNIIIALKPQIGVLRFEGQYAVFICSLPEYVKDDTRCNLYFGESLNAAAAAPIWTTERKNNPSFCLIVVQEETFWRNLRLVQQKEISCEYSVESAWRYLLPRSYPYRLTDTTNLTKGVISVSTSTTSGTTKPTMELTTVSTSNTLDGCMLIIAAAGGVLILIFILMVAACVRAKRRTDKQLHKRKHTHRHIADQSVVMNMIYNTEMLQSGGFSDAIMFVPNANCPAVSGKYPFENSRIDDAQSDLYQVYSIIAD